jgi:hypothetical protein
MSLRSDETLEAFLNRIIRNEKMMDILNLPTILDTDTEEIKKMKRKRIIDKAIVKSSQEPIELGKVYPEIEIDGVKYKNYAKTRLAISLAQSIKTGSYLFGNPQVDISIYYDNTNMPNVFKLLDLISDEFSGQNLTVELEDGKQMLKDIKCEGITSQVAIINNYERVGIRFSFYATLYKN